MNKLERFWVWISRHATVIAMALVTITAVIIVIANGYYSVSTPKTFDMEISGDFSDYQDLKSLEHELEYASEEKEEKKEEETVEKKPPALILAEAIRDNLNSYAKILGEGPVDSDRFIEYLNRRFDQLNPIEEDEVINILNHLKIQTEDMVAVAPSLSGYFVRDKRKIVGREYIAWYFDELEKNREEANEKSFEAESEFSTRKGIAAASWVALPIIGMVFVALLLLLVFLRIDFGIRLISRHIDGLNANSLSENRISESGSEKPETDETDETE
jgi:hypothetical protein